MEHYSSMDEEPAPMTQLAQQLSLNKRLKKFGKKGHNAACEELHQTHNRMVLKPTHASSLTPDKRKKAIKSLVFLPKKGWARKR